MSPLQPAQFQQLQMLMKPSEMQAQGVRFADMASDGDPEVDLDILRQTKLQEAGRPIWKSPTEQQGPSLARQMRDEGIRTPVSVWNQPGSKSTLMDGHHRFFVAERWEDKGEEVYLPVEHEGFA